MRKLLSLALMLTVTISMYAQVYNNKETLKKFNTIELCEWNAQTEEFIITNTMQSNATVTFDISSTNTAILDWGYSDLDDIHLFDLGNVPDNDNSGFSYYTYFDNKGEYNYLYYSKSEGKLYLYYTSDTGKRSRVGLFK